MKWLHPIVVFSLLLSSIVMINYIITEKYEFVGRLLRPGEQPINYSDEEDESNASSSEKPKEQESGEKSKDD